MRSTKMLRILGVIAVTLSFNTVGYTTAPEVSSLSEVNEKKIAVPFGAESLILATGSSKSKLVKNFAKNNALKNESSVKVVNRHAVDHFGKAMLGTGYTIIGVASDVSYSGQV